jgi:uncharacterized protein (TIGR03067 family)
MNRRLSNLGIWVLSATALVCDSTFGQNAAYTELKGSWQATELVDNGRVVPSDAIASFIPSGGRVEIVDNSIVFTSPKDGQRHARVFSVDATTYPRQLNILDGDKISGQGIYKIDNGNLVVCLSPVSQTARPTEFTSRENSQRALIVFKRVDSNLNAPTTSAQTVAANTVLTLPPPPVASLPAPPAGQPTIDTSLAHYLPGTWKYTDKYGGIFLSLDRNGTYSTYREQADASAFQQVFRKLPLSSGAWRIQNGQAVLQCTSAVYSDRVNKTFQFTIRSVGPTELQFVDYAGNAGKAVRVQ